MMQIQTIDVTITVGNPGSGNRYYVNGVLEGPITLIEGNTYKFIQNDSSNLTHQLYISTTQNGHTGGQYNYVENGVTYWLDGPKLLTWSIWNRFVPWQLKDRNRST